MFLIWFSIYFDTKIFNIIRKMKYLPIKLKFNNTFIFFRSWFKYNISVFLTLKEISFALNQLDKFRKSILISLLSFSMRLVRNKGLILSTKCWTLQIFIALCKSFIYSKNRRRPKTDPWGTPYAMEERKEL